jgi:hypothetical protein
LVAVLSGVRGGAGTITLSPGGRLVSKVKEH